MFVATVFVVIVIPISIMEDKDIIWLDVAMNNILLILELGQVSVTGTHTGTVQGCNRLPNI
jgi:hypothetical protein